LDKETAKKLHHMKNLSDESKATGITTTKKTSSVRKTKTIGSTKRSKVTK
jgi:hypothetical protein